VILPDQVDPNLVCNDSKAKAPTHEEVAEEETANKSVREPSSIQGTMRRNYLRFRRCYEAGLLKNPNLEGLVTTQFRILADGTIRDICIREESTLPDKFALQCIADEYSKLRFSQASRPVTVVYPILFSPG
jgi:hypothetical protein